MNVDPSAGLNASIVCLDKMTYAAHPDTLTPVVDGRRAVFEKVDICNRAEVERVFRDHQPDAVMHLAAESHVDRSIEIPGVFIETNVVGTYVMLEASRQYWAGLGRGAACGFPLSPHLDRRGLRFPWRDRQVHGDDTLRAKLSLFGQQGFGGPSRPGVASHPWPAGRHQQLLQQLRTVEIK